jgi:hypothetical protein
MKRFWAILTLALAAALLPLALPGPALAADCAGSQNVFGNSYTLASGQQLDTNLVVLGGNATIAAGATANCQVVVWGGNLDVAGKIGKDVVVWGGNVHLYSSAEIDGRLQSLGGAVTQDDGAQIKGGVSQGFGPGNAPPAPAPSFNGGFSVVAMVVEFYRAVTRTVLGSLGMGLLALLVVLIWPEQIARVRGTLTNAPAQSGGLGLLTVVAVPVLIVVATLTICLIPVAFMAMVLLTVAVAFGWIALGELVGQRLVSAFNWVNLSQAVAAAIGTALLSLGVSVVSLAPCVGWVVPLILAAIGLGAVTLTRFGTLPYFPASPAVPPAPPAVPSEPALNA